MWKIYKSESLSNLKHRRELLISEVAKFFILFKIFPMMLTKNDHLAVATSNLKNGTDFSIAAIMARDDMSHESSEYSRSKNCVWKHSKHYEKSLKNHLKMLRLPPSDEVTKIPSHAFKWKVLIIWNDSAS